MKDLNLSTVRDYHRNNPTAFSLRISHLLFRHLKIYTGWSFCNIFVSLLFLIDSSGSLYYFMMMNFAWGLVNMGFATLFYLHINAQHFRKKSVDDQIKIERHICKMLFINIVLNFGFVLSGIWFILLAEEFSLYKMYRAFGGAIILQGIFLLLQDMWFYSRHRRNLKGGQKRDAVSPDFRE